MVDCSADRESLVLDSPTTVDLPLLLRTPSVINFDTERFNLRRAAVDMLRESGDLIGRFPDGVEDLECFVAHSSVFRSFQARLRLRERVSASAEFLRVYESLVLDVVCPALKQRLVSVVGEPGPTRFYYQYPPTVRLQPGPSREFKRPHRDSEYGHQVGEINFWMPLTNYSNMTRTTLWVESEPDVGDYSPLEVDFGSIAVFHGTLCRHHVPPNSSSFTRVSMDFRVGIGVFYDSSWLPEDVKVRHGHRECVL